MTIDSGHYDKKPSIHRIHKVGPLLIIVIDEKIANQLRLREDTYFYEILTTDGDILLRRGQDSAKENMH